MPACERCGRENPDDASFCNGCGAVLAAPAPPREVRKTVTVLFCDVAGSTALGERLDPEALRARMSRYFDEMRGILERHGGTVEKFIGDAVMALFGIPVLHEDDALRAVRAAAEMREAIPAHGLEARIGINTGEVVAGEGETLATGDAVNVAARLEQAAAAGEVLLGEATLALVRDAVEVEEGGRLELKGKTDPVAAYRLLSVRAGAAPFARRLDAPMVGREAELGALRQAYARAVRERAPHLFTLLGAAGIGKSRLTHELVSEIRAEATALRGRCLPYGEGITYWPLVEMLEEAAHHELRARLVELLAGEPEAELIAGRLAAVVGAEGPAATSEEMFWAVRKLFERLARERPLVVVFDDLHWAEPTLLDLVDHLVDWSRGVPILVLCLARPELLELRPAWGGGKLNATSILLEPLSDDESAELIERLLGESELEPRIRTRIAQAAEGNPLFVEQMLAMLRDDGAGPEPIVPPTIQALLAARLDRLGRDERAVIERAAIEGKVFHRSAVAELVAEDLRPTVGTHLLSLIRKELIRPETEPSPDDHVFRFRHLLIRDAAYEALPKEERAQLHERFAEWLERRYAAGIVEVEEIVGYHLEQAYRYRAELGAIGGEELALARRAAARLTASGRRAVLRADLPAALGLLARAIALLPADDPERFALAPDLAEACVDAGRFARADELVAEALVAPDPVVRARALLVRVMTAAQTGGAMSDALVDVERASAELERLGDVVGVAKARLVLARTYFFLGRAGEADAEYARAVRLARKANIPAIENQGRWALGAKLHGPATVEEATAYADDVLARQGGNAQADAFALCVRGVFAAMQGKFDEGRAFVDRGKTLADEFGLVLRRGIGSTQEADVEVLAGDFEAAARALEEGSAILASVGEVGYRSTVDAQLAAVLAELGRDADAERLARDVLSYAGEDDFEPQARARGVLAMVLARRGELDEAEQLARESVALLDATDYLLEQADTRLALAKVLRHAGRVGEAADAAAEAASLYARKGNVVMEARAKALLEELGAPA